MKRKFILCEEDLEKDTTRLTIEKLRQIIEDLPDDMEVIVPVPCFDDANQISGFRYVRTAGIVSCYFEKVLCLAGSTKEKKLDDLVATYEGEATTCPQVLF